jgi:ribosomal-protein-alanine N-acetyltransferase
MRTDDIPDIVNIERVSFSTPWSESSFQAELQNEHSIVKVADMENTIVAYICVRVVVDECHLVNVTVHPHFRQRGIAAVLLQDVLSELMRGNARSIYLEVRVSNIAARKLYENAGFKAVGTRKSCYLLPVEDAIIMMREL